MNLFELDFRIPYETRLYQIREHAGTPFFYNDFECATCGKNLDVNSYSGEFCCTRCAEVDRLNKRYGGN